MRKYSQDNKMIALSLRPSLLERIGVRMLLFAALLLVGCTEASVLYDLELKGHVIIRPDANEYSLPNIQYYFYCTDNRELSPGPFPCHGKGNYADDLPVGKYCVLGVNEVSNVIYSGMGSYETAVAAMQPRTALARGATQFLQPGDLYTVTLDEVAASATDTVRRTPAPSLLTRHLLLDIALDAELMGTVTHIDGVLHGVYPSVYLFTGLSESEGLNPETGSVVFDTHRETAGWSVDVSLFNMRDPERGESYQNVLELNLTQEGGVQYVEVDISEFLSDAISDNGGELPMRIPVEIEVEKSDDIKLHATVKPWVDSGTGGGSIGGDF